MSSRSILRSTPVLVVEAIEPSLPFWIEGLGFEKTVEVPDGDRLGFAILQCGDVEVMLQTRASVAGDQPALADSGEGTRTCLFVEVADLDAVTERLGAVEVLVPRRESFYGFAELVVREPGGHAVTLAQNLRR